MTRQEFVNLEFRKRNIPLITETDRIDERDFSRMWNDEESAVRELSELEQKAQVQAEKDAPVPFRRWKYPKNRKTLEAEFARCYEEYVTTGAISGLSRWMSQEGHLLDLLGQLYTYRAYLRIRSALVYIDGDEEDIVQAGHMGALAKIRKDQESGIPETNPVQYFTAIYKNKTRDYLRHYNLLKTPEDLEAEAQAESELRGRKRIGHSVYDFRNTVKLDAMVAGEDGDDLSDRIRALSTNFLEDDLHNYEDLSHMVTTAYLMCLMNSRNVPAAPMSVMYARVLFQLERLMDPESIDAGIADYMSRKNRDYQDAGEYANTLYKASAEAQKYTTASSVKWALTRMGNKTVAHLAEDSERSLHINFDEDEALCWGEPLRRQLTEPAGFGTDLLWKDLSPVRDLSEKKIEDWATDVHNATVISTAKTLYEDKELRGCVLTILSNGNGLVKEIRKRERKEKKEKEKLERCSGKEM